MPQVGQNPAPSGTADWQVEQVEAMCPDYRSRVETVRRSVHYAPRRAVASALRLDPRDDVGDVLVFEAVREGGHAVLAV